MKLTKKAIDAIKPAPHDQVHWDDELRGFGLRTKRSGLKSFLIQYRNRQGRSRRLTVGNYGRLTPDEARREARPFSAMSKGALIRSSSGSTSVT
jgi:hypothetical protein